MLRALDGLHVGALGGVYDVPDLIWATGGHLADLVDYGNLSSTGKTSHVGGEKKMLEFRASAFNLANRHLLGCLTTGLTSADFGQLSNPQTNQPRNVEFNLRLGY